MTVSLKTAGGDTLPTQTPMRRQDIVALWIGIAASALFVSLIWLLGARLAAIPHRPDQGASWYYWILVTPTFWSRATAWGFYLLHQGAIWWLIFMAQRQRKGYRTSLHWFNYAALAINAIFIALHLLQTHLWYDGLAQDVSIWSSQWSVILLLVLVLMMENPRRGLFFGYKAPLAKRYAVVFIVAGLISLGLWLAQRLARPINPGATA